jgi:hypothetical protein
MPIRSIVIQFVLLGLVTATRCGALHHAMPNGDWQPHIYFSKYQLSSSDYVMLTRYFRATSDASSSRRAEGGK